MSLRDKLQNHPAPGANLPIAPRPEVMAPAPRKTISQGRPRKQYTKAHHALDSIKAVSVWVAERLIPRPENCVYIGGRLNSYTIRNRSGGRQRVTPYYESVTLRGDFEEFCAQRSWPLPPMKTFSGLVLKALVEQGIPARADRTHRQRRKIIRGIAIVGTGQDWDGNEKSL